MQKRHRAHGATALLACALGGCSGYAVHTTATSPPYDPFGRLPLSHGQVCVFRPATIGAALITPVLDNGVVVGATQGPSYFCYLAGPGEHRVSVEVSDAETFTLSVDTGHRYFLEHRVEVGRDALVAVDGHRAADLVKRCDYATVVEAPRGRPLPPVVPYVAGLPAGP